MQNVLLLSTAFLINLQLLHIHLIVINVLKMQQQALDPFKPGAQLLQLYIKK